MTVQKFKTLDEFINSLDEDKKAQVTVLRQIVLQADPNLTEHIKWNAPSYELDGQDRITFNLMNKEGSVKLVLHMGATTKEDKNAPPIIDDDSGMIEWNSNIRGVLTFVGLKDIDTKQDTILKLLKRWLSTAQV